MDYRALLALTRLHDRQLEALRRCVDELRRRQIIFAMLLALPLSAALWSVAGNYRRRMLKLMRALAARDGGPRSSCPDAFVVRRRHYSLIDFALQTAA